MATASTNFYGNWWLNGLMVIPLYKELSEDVFISNIKRVLVLCHEASVRAVLASEPDLQDQEWFAYEEDDFHYGKSIDLRSRQVFISSEIISDIDATTFQEQTREITIVAGVGEAGDSDIGYRLSAKILNGFKRVLATMPLTELTFGIDPEDFNIKLFRGNSIAKPDVSNKTIAAINLGKVPELKYIFTSKTGINPEGY